MTVTPQPRQR